MSMTISAISRRISRSLCSRLSLACSRALASLAEEVRFPFSAPAVRVCLLAEPDLADVEERAPEVLFLREEAEARADALPVLFVFVFVVLFCAMDCLCDCIGQSIETIRCHSHHRHRSRCRNSPDPQRYPSHPSDRNPSVHAGAVWVQGEDFLKICCPHCRIRRGKVPDPAGEGKSAALVLLSEGALFPGRPSLLMGSSCKKMKIVFSLCKARFPFCV